MKIGVGKHVECVKERVNSPVVPLGKCSRAGSSGLMRSSANSSASRSTSRARLSVPDGSTAPGASTTSTAESVVSSAAIGCTLRA